MVFLLFFAIVAIVSVPIDCDGIQAQSQSAPTPLIVLHHKEGNFFVLASDIPFKVSQAEPEVTWMEVK